MHHALAFDFNISIDKWDSKKYKSDINRSELPVEQQKAIIGMHAFSGKGYMELDVGLNSFDVRLFHFNVELFYHIVRGNP